MALALGWRSRVRKPGCSCPPLPEVPGLATSEGHPGQPILNLPEVNEWSFLRSCLSRALSPPLPLDSSCCCCLLCSALGWALGIEGRAGHFPALLSPTPGSASSSPWRSGLKDRDQGGEPPCSLCCIVSRCQALPPDSSKLDLCLCTDCLYCYLLS